MILSDGLDGDGIWVDNLYRIPCLLSGLPDRCLQGGLPPLNATLYNGPRSSDTIMAGLKRHEIRILT